jgi:hypothetical protein
MSTPPGGNLAALQQRWAQDWPVALRLWSAFTRLREPLWCRTAAEAQAEGLTESFAMIRLSDHRVVIDLRSILEHQLTAFGREILAHEIGHHIYCPADLTDHARMLARMRPALPTREAKAPLIANLYADLLINDRLQRSRGLRLSTVYQQLAAPGDALWQLYMRIYEILWSLAAGTLAIGAGGDQLAGDAHLGARLIRAYASDWLDGSGRFAALCLPYLLGPESAALQHLPAIWHDLAATGRDGAVSGLTAIEADEESGAIHPAFDPRLSELEAEEAAPTPVSPATSTVASPPGGQYREPFAYGEILRALGMELDDHEIAVRYYRERAIPYLVPFPQQPTPRSVEPLPEGTEAWDIGAPLDDVDWLESIMVSPRPVPGVTTRQRTWGTMEGGQPHAEPLDLDLYVDCSGSMPDPQEEVSYLALAGTIVALSALRAGARVQATLWSGAGQYDTTGGFVGDERRILRVITGYLGGATAFPIHLLRDTYAGRSPAERPVHILVVSDDGVTTMFDRDERGNSGWDIARQALAAGRGGGSLALNLPPARQDATLDRAAAEGWSIYPVTTWEELVQFAQAFSRRHYARPGGNPQQGPQQGPSPKVKAESDDGAPAAQP